MSSDLFSEESLKNNLPIVAGVIVGLGALYGLRKYFSGGVNHTFRNLEG